ncbi:MAG: penicillin acylase family protein [Desulfobacterales bacterium]|nr:penicillin acylase family protein [Desulfobacterales bacterium]
MDTFGADGDKETINYGRHDGQGPYKMVSGASFRFVVELKDPVQSFAVVPSNNIDLKEFKNVSAIEMWRAGKLRKQLFSKEEIIANTVEKITFK